MKRISAGDQFLKPASGQAIREMMRQGAETIAAVRITAGMQQSQKTDSKKTEESPRKKSNVVVTIHAPQIQAFLANRKKKTEPSF